jgi:hypothetical protein
MTITTVTTMGKAMMRWDSSEQSMSLPPIFNYNSVLISTITTTINTSTTTTTTMTTMTLPTPAAAVSNNNNDHHYDG